jgi:hypothetical protein
MFTTSSAATWASRRRVRLASGASSLRHAVPLLERFRWLTWLPFGSTPTTANLGKICNIISSIINIHQLALRIVKIDVTWTKVNVDADNSVVVPCLSIELSKPTEFWHKRLPKTNI